MRKLKKTSKLVILILCVAIITALVTYSTQVKNAIYNSIVLCGKSVIPSLFPIFCITLLIINIGATALAPQKTISLFLFFLSMISGYPVGAKLLSTMVQNGQLKENSARKVLPTMICAGPAFIINIVGTQMFSDTLIGIRLYICQIAANLILFIINGGLTIDISRFASNVKVVKAVTNSVKQSADSVINICAYVILFSAISEIFTVILGNAFSKYFLYIFEVTGAVYNSDNIYITNAVLSWGGICVIFQVLSVANNLHSRALSIILSRIISVAISSSLLKLSFVIFPYVSPVISNTYVIPEPTIVDDIPFLVVFMLSLLVFLFSISSRSTGKFLKDITNQ